jgi:hypothetical protein
MNKLKLFWLKVDLWFNPYKYNEEGIKALYDHNNPKEKVKGLSKQQIVDSNMIALKIATVSKPIDLPSGIAILENKPFDNGIYYHNERYHQYLIKYDKGSGKRYQARNGNKRSRYRKKLKIYPKNVETYDLTHINSIGFHGDETFCIGFDSRLNREDMNRFEEKVRTINNEQPIYWFADIQLQEDFSVIWVATIVSLDGEILLQETFHDRSNFYWEIEWERKIV